MGKLNLLQGKHHRWHLTVGGIWYAVWITSHCYHDVPRMESLSCKERVAMSYSLLTS